MIAADAASGNPAAATCAKRLSANMVVFLFYIADCGLRIADCADNQFTQSAIRNR
jgi:hypothetical protein